MSEEENNGVVAQATEEIAQATESEATQSSQSEAQIAEAKRRNDAEYNWAEIREKTRRLERENQELKEGFQRLTQPKQVEEEDFGFKDEDLIEGKHLKNLVKEIKTLKNEIKQKEASTVEDRIQFKFPDYREVVTKENIEQLKETEPVLVKSLLALTDPYEQAEAAYRMLKKMAPTVAKEPPMSLEKKKALENAQKPLSVQAVSKTSAMADANVFADMDVKSRQEFLKSKYEEMKKAIKAG